MAPLSKVVYGSDGYALPEIAYTSAKLGKRALGQVLDGLVADGFLDGVEARDAARLILADNARELYRLD
jgi:predicted TIM-barrel fold metal-dependent hydrolase